MGDEVTKWNGVLLDAIRTDRTPPPPASRWMAMTHVAMHDAVQTIARTYKTYHLNANAAPATSKEAAAATAAHRVLSKAFPAQSAALDAQLAASLAAIPGGAPKDDGITLGRAAGDDILALRAADDGSQLGVPPAPGPGVWEPTPPALAPFAFPGWGTLAPFTMTTSSQFRGTGPAALNTGEYTHSFDQTKSLGAKVSAARTADQTEIALFWADGPATCTPPGHWHLIAGVVSQQKGYGLLDDARLFALLSLAQADAAISAWDMKRTYFNWRPITAIRKADTDGNPHTVKDPAWEPLIATPAFPDYVSGHSCFSEASAEILKRFTGNDQAAFSVGSDGMPGTSRSFTTFSAAADEAGLSRIYGGIHFQFSNKDAQQAGRKLAQQAFTKYLTKI